MLSMMSKHFSRQHLTFFFQGTGFDISCKLPPEETICMKYQILFSEKNKKQNIINLSSAELGQRMLLKLMNSTFKASMQNKNHYFHEKIIRKI